MIGPLVVAVLLLATSLPARVVVVVAAATAVIAAVPVLVGPMALLAGTLVLRQRFRARTVARKQAREDAALLADLTALALTGGLGIQPALELAAGAVGGQIADEVESLVRRARVEGLAAAMTGAAGAGRELYRVIGRAITTGSALLDQVIRVADELHADLGARRLEKARKVPVAMLFPLTLLILPGFLLLTIAPALLDAFAHLEI
jgi:tight adherence protein C